MTSIDPLIEGIGIRRAYNPQGLVRQARTLNTCVEIFSMPEPPF